MNREDLGNYFIKNGEIYWCIGYIDRPCLELKSIRTGQREVVIIGSLYAEDFKRLCTLDENSEGTPVTHIVLTEEVNK